MAEYAIITSRSIGGWLQGFYYDQSAWLPGILVAAALVLILVRLLRPPKV